MWSRARRQTTVPRLSMAVPGSPLVVEAIPAGGHVWYPLVANEKSPPRVDQAVEGSSFRGSVGDGEPTPFGTRSPARARASFKRHDSPEVTATVA